MTPIERAIEAAGGLSSLAERLKTSPQVISNWRARGSVPAVRVLDLERETGVSRHELRPDIYPKEVRAA